MWVNFQCHDALTKYHENLSVYGTHGLSSSGKESRLKTSYFVPLK
jgi:hypothetical protein